MKQQNEIAYFLKGCKTLSQVKNAITKFYSKGWAFMDNGEQYKLHAEQKAIELIKANINKIPTKIKRDITV